MNTALPPKVEAQLRDIAMASLNDFHAYMPMHSYIYVPTRELWPASSVNARIEQVALFDAKGRPILDKNDEPKMMAANAWLDRNRAVEQMTWAPGLPMLIRDRLIADGGWIERQNVTCFNLYRPPTIKPGDATKAGPWLKHADTVFGEEATHIVRYLAHRVQRPQEKINHALVLGGQQGIGKDTLLEPVKYAVGPWNFHEVSPQHLLGRFNGFLRAVILRVNEARDLGDIDRFQFYDHMKAYTAAPPDVLRVDEKHLREYSILNCCGVIITSTTRQTASTCRPMTAATMLPGRPAPRRISRRNIGINFGAGIKMAASQTSPPISPSSTSRPSTRKPHRKRRRHFGISSMQAGHPRTPNSPTCSTAWAAPKPRPSLGS
jgi:hypothetical protein